MIRGYSEIAFVYGQSTYNIADEVKKKIEDKYKNYPIKIRLCDDTSFRTAKDVLIAPVVEDEFKKAVFAVIFIGKDMLSYSFPKKYFESPLNKLPLQEIVKKELFGSKTQITSEEFLEWIDKNLKFTLSQNAVFEMGHLWTRLSFNNIRVVPVFSRNDNSYEYPSDIPLESMYRYYYDDGDENFYKSIEGLIEGTLNVRPNDNVLSDEGYQVDYKDLFTEDELEIIDSPRKNIEQQFEAINKLWTIQVDSLTKDYERLIFIYERLVFLSYLPYDKGYDGWLTTAMSEIKDKNTLFYKILSYIKEYIKTRSLEIRVKGNRFEIYKNIADKLCDIKNEITKQNIKINPLIEIYLNDYIGLACRVTVQNFEQLENKPHFDKTEYLNRSVISLKRCSEIETNLSSEAASLWSGYSVYNVARTYDVMGDNNNSLIYMAEACRIRESWLTMSSLGTMPRVFEHSFKAEFILAALDAIKKDCFEESEKSRIESRCREVLESLKFVKIESVAIVETAKNKFENSGL